MSLYLCYDLKGIQHYIFQVPRLKCCIGGSRQIDDFDRKDAGEIKEKGVKYTKIYTGGGKGAFRCDTAEEIKALKEALVAKAMAKGLTIRFGESDDYSEAAQNIVETYCYQPESLEGQPCSLSGMYPAPTKDGISALMKKRMDLGRQHDTKSATEEKFLTELRKSYPDCEFFYDVDDAGAKGRDGAEALGNRNRWAVVCMDGNDIGSQFLKFKETYPWNISENQEKWDKWLPDMSDRLDKCTCHAALEGMRKVAEEYYKDHDPKLYTTLPIRPLIVGGDDVTILVGCQYATLFVETVMDEFAKKSKELDEKWVEEDSQKQNLGVDHLWMGTNGALSISAGILYAPVSLPLHSALEFAESLLASAKTHGRDLKKKNNVAEPTPACLDWESVTEGLVETPARRRQKEFRFYDQDAGVHFELTCRPYSQDDFKNLEKFPIEKVLQGLPNTLKQKIHPALLACKADRLRFYAQIAKNYPELSKGLMEPVPGCETSYGVLWKEDTGNDGKTIVRTRLIDRFLLDQEKHRMTQETTGQN